MSDINITVNDEIVNVDVIDEPVLVNVVNSPGQQGPAGPGVPVGGTAGQILAKASATDYDTEWINNYAKYLATNVRNQTGSTIGAFQVVYISGATGNKPLISLADADTEATSSKTYGVTATAIANNGTGDVVTAGELSGIDTSAFNEGDLLWLSTTAGGVVTTPPAEPAHAVFIGYVVRSHPTLGTIDVSIQNGYELNELHGVQITTPTDNQGLFYNSTSTLWENKSITTALGYTPVPTTRNITINGVTYDLSADRSWTIAAGISGSGASGQVTYWTGASAVSGSNNLFWDNANSRLGIGTNAPNAEIQITKASAAAGAVGQRVYNTTSSGETYHAIYNDLNEFGSLGIFGSTWGNTNQRRTASFASSALNGFNIAIFNSSATANFSILTGTTLTERLRLYNNTGNLVLQNGGTFTDGGQRLQVIGDTLLRGSGATSATTALTVQNSSSTNLFRVRNDGVYILGNSASAPAYFTQTNSPLSVDLSGTNLTFYSSTNTQSASGGRYWFGGMAMLQTSGDNYNFISQSSFSPTSGTATLANILIAGTINQTGGANGITRGLYVNPTLTAAADFRAIETTAGNVLFGSNFFWDNANSRLGIGTNAPLSPLHVVGSVIALRATLANGDGGVISNDTTTTYFQALTSANNVRDFNISGQKIIFRSGTNSYSQKMSLEATGNVMIGTTSDLGVRLGVIGDTLLRGSGATNATTALTVQNSSSTNLFTVRNDGLSTFSNTIVVSTGVSSGILFSGTRFSEPISASTYTQILIQPSSGNKAAVFQFAPSGTSTASAMEFYHSSALTITDRFVFKNTNGLLQIGADGSALPLSFISNNINHVYMFANGNLMVQNGGTFTDVASSRFTINSSTQGFLPPRMTTTQKNAIASPAAGLVVYDTTLNKLCVYTTSWETITSI